MDLRYDTNRQPYLLDLTQLDLNKISDLETVWDRTNKVLVIRDGDKIYKLNSAGATLLSPNGSKFKVVVDNDGNLTTEVSDDPNVQGEVDQINGFITAINGKISTIDSKLLTIDGELTNCENKINDFKTEVATIKPALDQSILDAKAQEAALTQSINEGNTANAAMNASIVVSTQLNTDLENTSNIATVRKQDLETTISQVPAQIKSITDEGTAQIVRVQTEGTNQVQAVDAKTNDVVSQVVAQGNIQEARLTAHEQTLEGTFNSNIANTLQDAHNQADSIEAQTNTAINDGNQMLSRLTSEGGVQYNRIQTEGTHQYVQIISKSASEIAKVQVEGDSAVNDIKVEADKITALLANAPTGGKALSVGDTTEVELTRRDLASSAMSKAEFEALQENRKRNNAGSGFKEWGKHYGNNANVNEGIFTYPLSSYPNTFRMGRYNNDGLGISKTESPITIVNGIQHKINGVNFGGSSVSNEIKFPDAPDGTKTYDSATGVVTQHASSNEAFEGLVTNGDFRDGTTGWNPSNDVTLNVVSGNLEIISPTTGTGNWKVNSQNANYMNGVKYKVEINVEQANDSLRFYWYTDSTTYHNIQLKAGINKVEYTWVGSDNSARAAIYLQTSSRSGNKSIIRSTSIMPVTENVITSRQDLCFLETWAEDIEEKDLVCDTPQYGASTYEGIPTVDITSLGVQQGYSAFGEWDTTTVGKAIRWSTLSDANKKKILGNPSHNIYHDAENDKFIQYRYRIRVVEGLGNDWENPRLLKYSNNKFVAHQRVSVVPTSYASSIKFSPNYNNDAGLLGRVDTMAIPICLVQRLNQGAYHPTYNPEGCARYAIGGVGYFDWFSSNVDWVHSKSDCFIPYPANNKGSAQGNIGSTKGRNDQYEFYDAIYTGQVKDLRLDCNKYPVNEVREDATRKAIAGEMRGWGKVPFTKIYDDVADVEDGYEVVTQSLSNKIVAMKYLDSQYDSLPWQDIIGDPANIQATFPNGVLGQWIPQIPDGTSKFWNYNRKNSNGSGTYFLTGNNGTAWSTGSVTFDSIKNGTQNSISANEVQLRIYEALSDFTAPQANSKVVGSVGDVFAPLTNQIKGGNRLMPSLIGKINVSSLKPRDSVIGNVLNEKFRDYTAGTLKTVKLSPLFLVGTNDTVKALSTITEKDGLLYLQLHYRELVYDSTGTAGNKWGSITAGTDYHAPYSRIPIVDNDSTETDMNGTTVKIGCHHSLIPLGIAKGGM